MPIDGVEMMPEPRIPSGFVADLKNRNETESLAFEHTSPDYFVICGFLPGDSVHRLYALPKTSLGELCDLFHVGNRPGGMQPNMDEALNQLEAINQQSEIIPFLADPAGLKLRIRTPLTDATATLIDKTIDHFAAEPMMDADGYVSSTIAKTGVIHFWWS